MCDDRVDADDVGVFVVHVEEIDLMGKRAAVEAALLDQHHVVAVRIGVDG